ncbi:hypothetical protein PAXRUDRAFT_835662 [Paxillus rubicundulus Ve08.2h10]|uniref:Protein kinase domain-containing protein n=1 Tax=Paxillus rubicundulus Ve08.2h10 TaxID=930991 RepID=A0A0D0D5W7_9AGAM|nr:hypothetical protein PAXRUDRAFT_835662 [Paxillus rubicundulus Ve08.2h10]
MLKLLAWISPVSWFHWVKEAKEQSPPSDLTTHVFRQSLYQTVDGQWSDIWKCIIKKGSKSEEVAVKSFRSHFLEDDDICNINETLHRELEVAARVNHESLLPLLGITTGFGRFVALVYPWMVNGTLTTYLQRKREQLSLLDRLELLRDVAAGLRYLHSHCIVHGQLTGCDILVSAAGRAQISGVGLFGIMLELFGKSYLSLSMIRAVRWAAPEAITADEDEASTWNPTEQSDIYAFGSIMFQVCSGEIPYAHLKNDVQVLLALSTDVKPSRPQTVWMNDRIWNFIQRCWLTKELGAKRPSAEEALDFINKELGLVGPHFCLGSDRSPIDAPDCF